MDVSLRSEWRQRTTDHLTLKKPHTLHLLPFAGTSMCSLSWASNSIWGVAIPWAILKKNTKSNCVVCYGTSFKFKADILREPQTSPVCSPFLPWLRTRQQHVSASVQGCWKPKPEQWSHSLFNWEDKGPTRQFLGISLSFQEILPQNMCGIYRKQFPPFIPDLHCSNKKPWEFLLTLLKLGFPPAQFPTDWSKSDLLSSSTSGETSNPLLYSWGKRKLWTVSSTVQSWVHLKSPVTKHIT